LRDVTPFTPALRARAARRVAGRSGTQPAYNRILSPVFPPPLGWKSSAPGSSGGFFFSLAANQTSLQPGSGTLSDFGLGYVTKCRAIEHCPSDRPSDRRHRPDSDRQWDVTRARCRNAAMANAGGTARVW